MFHSSATVLHPCHKLAYFKSASWSSEWIKTAKELVTNAYNNSYATCAAVKTAASTEVDDDLEHVVDKPMVSKTSLTTFHALPSPCLSYPTMSWILILPWLLRMCRMLLHGGWSTVQPFHNSLVWQSTISLSLASSFTNASLGVWY